MKSLYEQENAKEIFERIDKLSPASQRQWGKMEVAQMMKHCTISIEMAAGKKFPPRVFIGRLIGSFLKPLTYNDRPIKKNSPTDKSFIVSDKRDFYKEKAELTKIIQQFSEGGAEKCTSHPHSFFGKLTPEQWGKSVYKHLDHHLKQFGV